MKRFTNHLEPWGEFLDVKHWDKIKNPKKYAGKELFIGSVTNPYNPQEEIFGRTRALLTELQGSGAKLSIATGMAASCCGDSRMSVLFYREKSYHTGGLLANQRTGLPQYAVFAGIRTQRRTLSKLRE